MNNLIKLPLTVELSLCPPCRQGRHKDCESHRLTVCACAVKRHYTPPAITRGPVNWGCIAALVLDALIWAGVIWLALNWRPGW